MYHIKIVDDDIEFIKYMKDIITNSCINDELYDIEGFGSGEEFTEKLDSLDFCDLLILDMQMKKLDGHATAQIFREKFPEAILVFCSGVSYPTDESFKTTPFRYLLKSYSEDKMKMEMEAIIRELQRKSQEAFIVGHNRKNIIKLRPSDILFIENNKRGSIIHMTENKSKEFPFQVNSKEKLKELYKQLAPYHFEYAHNSYLVNLRYVTKYMAAGYIELTDGTQLNVSRSKQQTFKLALVTLVAEKYD